MEPLTRGQRRSEYQRQYREKHKEHLKELNEALYIKNYEKLFKKHDCICGGQYSLNHKVRHEKKQKTPTSPRTSTYLKLMVKVPLHPNSSQAKPTI